MSARHGAGDTRDAEDIITPMSRTVSPGESPHLRHARHAGDVSGSVDADVSTSTVYVYDEDVVEAVCIRCGGALDSNFAPGQRHWCLSCDAQDARKRRDRQRLERFKRQDEYGCWGWTGLTLRDGTPLLGRKRRRKVVYVAWRLSVGEIPAGMKLARTCATPGCWRPEHHETIPTDVYIDDLERKVDDLRVKWSEDRDSHDVTEALVDAIARRDEARAQVDRLTARTDRRYGHEVPLRS